jgi:putative oxidoreductase
MSLLRKPGIQAGIRFAFAALFLWSAVSKLANPSAFLGSVYGYEIPLPRIALQLVAVVLPWVELLCGFLLLTNVWGDTVWGCVAAMMAVFVVTTGQAWARGLKIACGCFNLKLLGIDADTPAARFLESVGFAFFRNLMLFALAFVMLRLVLRAGVLTTAIDPGIPVPVAGQPLEAKRQAPARTTQRKRRN